jgi:hypothetical protein
MQRVIKMDTDFFNQLYAVFLNFVSKADTQSKTINTSTSDIKDIMNLISSNSTSIDIDPTSQDNSYDENCFYLTIDDYIHIDDTLVGILYSLENKEFGIDNEEYFNKNLSSLIESTNILNDYHRFFKNESTR